MAESLLVFGGAGFIGSNFARLALAATDMNVVVADKLTYAGSRESLLGLDNDGRFDFKQVDICNRPDVDRLLQSYHPNWVVNFAAESHVDRSIDGPRTFIETNFVGAFEVLDASLRYYESLRGSARDGFRVLHVSTDEVYGSLGATGAFSEETPYAPNSPYAATKAGADHLVRAYRETYRLPVLLTNCSNNYGPFQFPEKLLPLMTLNALEARPLPIYGDGLNVRDWLFVEDHCAAILLVLERGRLGEKYNVGGGGERTNLEVVEALCISLEAVSPARENLLLRARGMESYAELKTFVADRPGHDRRYAIDSSKIRNELGWAPRHTLEAGIARTVEWYVKNRAWCTAVQHGKYERERLGTGAAASS